MIYNKLMNVYVAQCSKLENDVIKATNNLIKTDFSLSAYEELIRAKAVEEWHREYFKGVLDYIKVLDNIT